MSKSRMRRKAAALFGAAALLSGLGSTGTSAMDRRDKMKTKSAQGRRKDSMTVGETMVGSKVKTGVDYDAGPRERRDVADKARSVNTKSRKEVEKRREEGKLSPTMPKRKSQVGSDFGLNIMGGAKRGKMIKARGGGMARMRPTKLF